MPTKIQQCFLQACANHGALNLQDAIKILDSLHEKYDGPSVTEKTVRETVKLINQNIAEFNQQLKFFYHDLLRAEYLVFASIAGTDINKIQSKYSQADCNYFGSILKEIALSENLSITPINALNLGSACSSKSVPKKHAEDLIQDWCTVGYLVQVNDVISFGPRAVVEFMNFINLNYPDCVQDCSFCMKPLFWAVTCDACEDLFHRECIYKYLSKMTTCPSCREPWNKRID